MLKSIVKILLIVCLLVYACLFLKNCFKKTETKVGQAVITVIDSPAVKLAEDVAPKSVKQDLNSIANVINKNITPQVKKNENKAQQEYNAIPSKFRWDFHIDVSIYDDLIFPHLPGVALGASLFSDGKSKRDNRFRFLRFSIGGWKDVLEVGFAPLMYNLGNKIELFSNTYIYPLINFDVLNNRTSLGLGLSLSF